jgi:hypothetical protein
MRATGPWKQKKPSTKAQKRSDARTAAFKESNNPKLKMHKPGSQNLRKGF